MNQNATIAYYWGLLYILKKNWWKNQRLMLTVEKEQPRKKVFLSCIRGTTSNNETQEDGSQDLHILLHHILYNAEEIYDKMPFFLLSKDSNLDPELKN